MARLRDRQRAQQDGVGEAEDGAVGTDAERERERGDGGEAGTFCENTDRIPDISAQLIEEAGSPGLSRILPNRGHAAEFGAGAAQGLVARHPVAHQLLTVAFDVEL